MPAPACSPSNPWSIRTKHSSISGGRIPSSEHCCPARFLQQRDAGIAAPRCARRWPPARISQTGCPPFALLVAALLPIHLWLDASCARTGQNRVADELSGNGIYVFFSPAMNGRPHLDRDHLTRSGGASAIPPSRKRVIGHSGHRTLHFDRFSQKQGRAATQCLAAPEPLA
jgi:hypothetical protein